MCNTCDSVNCKIKRDGTINSTISFCYYRLVAHTYYAQSKKGWLAQLDYSIQLVAKQLIVLEVRIA